MSPIAILTCYFKTGITLFQTVNRWDDFFENVNVYKTKFERVVSELLNCMGIPRKNSPEQYVGSYYNRTIVTNYTILIDSY